MFKQNKSEAPRRERNGFTSHILLQQGDILDVRLAITWVDVAHGSSQRPHSHGSEQVYVIIKGKGQMRVGDEKREVVEDDLIFIPPHVVHSIENSLNEVLQQLLHST